jgi:hypothetical protein
LRRRRPKAGDQDRLLVRDGRRSYRRSFSRTEARWGAVILVALLAIAAWVAWRGAHPDAELFAAATDISSPQKLPPVDSAPRTVPSGAPKPASEDRAPFPADLASAGWHEAGRVSHFDSANLYVKIDGREGYYKSFGFRQLHWVALVAADDPATTVDIELFDLGSAANALGAYAGERSADAAPQVGTSGLWHRDRNAVFATIGPYYVRLVGSDESERVRAQLEHGRRALVAALPGEPLPWGYTLLAAGMGLDPGRIAFVGENAFSFGFARRVYTAPTGDGDLEVFAVATQDEAAARALAGRFTNSFLEYGEDAGTSGGHRWARDRYLHTVATAEACGSMVTGVRGAADAARGTTALEALKKAVRALPAEVAARARADAAAAVASETAPSVGSDGDEGHGSATSPDGAR